MALITKSSEYAASVYTFFTALYCPLFYIDILLRHDCLKEHPMFLPSFSKTTAIPSMYLCLIRCETPPAALTLGAERENGVSTRSAVATVLNVLIHPAQDHAQHEPERCATVAKRGVIGSLWGANPSRLIPPAAPAKVLVLLFVTSCPQASPNNGLPHVFHVTEKRLS